MVPVRRRVARIASAREPISRFLVFSADMSTVTWISSYGSVPRASPTKKSTFLFVRGSVYEVNASILLNASRRKSSPCTAVSKRLPISCWFAWAIPGSAAYTLFVAVLSGDIDTEYSGSSSRRCACLNSLIAPLIVSHDVRYPTARRLSTRLLMESSHPVFLRQKSATWLARSMSMRR